MENHKFLWGAILVVMIIAIGAYSFPASRVVIDKALGAVGTRFPNGLAVGSTASVTQNKLTVGNAGTAIGNLVFGTCTILANASVAATSTSNFDCAFTGAVSGDKVVASLAASSTLASQYVIKGVSASSTSDFITFSILNLTGGAAVPAATNGFGSSTQIILVR